MTWKLKTPYCMEREPYRITKAGTPDGWVYTAWVRRDGWQALCYGTREECEQAIEDDEDEPEYVEGCR